MYYTFSLLCCKEQWACWNKTETEPSTRLMKLRTLKYTKHRTAIGIRELVWVGFVMRRTQCGEWIICNMKHILLFLAHLNCMTSFGESSKTNINFSFRLSSIYIFVCKYCITANFKAINKCTKPLPMFKMSSKAVVFTVVKPLYMLQKMYH